MEDIITNVFKKLEKMKEVQQRNVDKIRNSQIMEG